MMKIGWLSRLSNQQLSLAMPQRLAGCCGIAIAIMMTGVAGAQNPTVPNEAPQTQITAPEGYRVHHSVDLGGNLVSVQGSQAMYDTLVNQQSGPRVQGETLELHALPGNKHSLIDDLRAFGSGFGGDANSVSKLDFSKNKVYEFTGLFRRDRQYFDYDLLANANIVPSTINNMVNGVAAPAAPWASEQQSSVWFNTVRRMLDTGLTLYPQSKFTYRFAYSHNTFQGPSSTPGDTTGKYVTLLEEFQRNSTDNYSLALDWKPLHETKVTFEEEMNNFKDDSYFTIAPSEFIAQEADGTPVALGNWNSQAAYGIAGCNTVAMGSAYTSATNYTILTASQNGGLPVINQACDVLTSYSRTQPTRILTPTSILRIQSNSIKNISMNGDFRYTLANMTLSNYNENIQGLSGAIRSWAYSGSARAHRAVVSADYGLTWQATSKFSLSDQVNYSNTHQPGYATFNPLTELTTPTAAGGVVGVNGCVTATAGGCETINYSGPLTTVSSTSTFSGSSTGLINAYLGQSILTNNATATWDGWSRARFSLTYRYGTHTIGEGQQSSATTPMPAGNQPLALNSDINGTVTINENAGIFTAAVRPTAKWDINGSVEVAYADNAFTPVGPRQTKHYRVHTKYKLNPWTTISGAYNDRERHNNTNNQQADIAAKNLPYIGPLNHVDYSRVASVGAQINPNEHFGVDFNYAYSDVYMASNICYFNGVATTLPGVPGTASLNSSGQPNTCATSVATAAAPTDWFARDFSDAPTQSGQASVKLSPDKSFVANVGYRVNAVRGSQFFNDARGVNGALNSTYQTPFLKVAWTVRPGLIWKGEYSTYRYGEGGPSGPQYCTTTVANLATAASVVPCTSLAAPTGLTEPTSGETAPRVFRANNVVLGIHYEF